ncbi:glucosidase family protein [Krasilnikoviella flava]|uniref:Alpha-L-rhamnosidase six-hairpin glycosidase domain-containing protein n=1 Tax=Krasilnikoviella flava TaxID=526729 RepID=A0A1T5KTJ0_9MICO|nr:hypothetical protein [Krasilnikoviella flava]SKC66558.1 hypothetical protein SAMN04324258_2336 [Krasilnikoviella flava]
MTTTVGASSMPWLTELYALAQETLDRNVVRDDAGPFIRAGGGYADPWTRDAALNCWGAATLLRPDDARATLLRVCERTPDGRLVVAQDDQWWDQIVWVLAATDHAWATGDDEFLATAWQVGRDSLEILHRERFRPRWGLYAGPALMQDGISGLPAGPATADEPTSFVLDYPDAHEVMTLSTNVVYVAALRCLEAAAHRLGHDASALAARADDLAAAIEEHLRDGDNYGYLLHGSGPRAGTLDRHREAAGLALAVVVGLVPPERSRQVIASIGRGPAGVVNVAPHFDRYDDDRSGRHNAMCWPMVMGLAGLASAVSGDRAGTVRTLEDLHRLVGARGGRFDELYDPSTGLAHGGWQCGHVWPSEPDQTWSATSLLRLVHLGLVGLVPSAEGLRFSPVPLDVDESVELRGLPYGAATLDVTVRGVTEVRGGPVVLVDGADVSDDYVHVPAGATGAHRVEVLVGTAG